MTNEASAQRLAVASRAEAVIYEASNPELHGRACREIAASLSVSLRRFHGSNVPSCNLTQSALRCSGTERARQRSARYRQGYLCGWTIRLDRRSGSFQFGRVGPDDRAANSLEPDCGGRGHNLDLRRRHTFHRRQFSVGRRGKPAFCGGGVTDMTVVDGRLFVEETTQHQKFYRARALPQINNV